MSEKDKKLLEELKKKTEIITKVKADIVKDFSAMITSIVNEQVKKHQESIDSNSVIILLAEVLVEHGASTLISYILEDATSAAGSILQLIESLLSGVKRGIEYATNQYMLDILSTRLMASSKSKDSVN